MPYNSVAELPENVRKMPPSMQRQWMAVWNSTYNRCKKGGKGGCEEEAFRMANGVLKNRVSGAEASDYAYVPDPDKPSTWKLRIDDAAHVGAAAAALGAGFRGQKVDIPSSARSAVVAKVRAAWKKFNPDKSPDEMPESIKGSGDGTTHEKMTGSHTHVHNHGEGSHEHRHDHDSDASHFHMSDHTRDHMATLRASYSEDVGDHADVSGQHTHVHAHNGKVHSHDHEHDGDSSHVHEHTDEEASDLADVSEDEGSEKVSKSRRFLERLVGMLNPVTAKSRKAHEFDPDGDGDDDSAWKFPKDDERVNFRDAESAKERCGNCCFFDAECGECFLVEGSIGQDDTCNLIRTDVEPDDTYSEARFHQAVASLRFAEPRDWIPYLPKPGKYKHPTIGEIDLDEPLVQSFIDNFKNGVYQKELPIDAEHELKLSGAVGWIKDLRRAADGSTEARVDWNDRGRSFISNDRFKYFSPEWYKVWEQPDTGKTFKNVLIGGALTTRPFFKEGSLKSLAASENSPAGGAALTFLPIRGSRSTEVTDAQLLEQFKASEVARKDQEAKFQASEKAREDLEARFAASEKSREAAEESRKAAESRIAAAEARIASAEKDKRRQAFSELSRGWSGDHDKLTSMLEKMAEKFGEESDEFKEYVQEHVAMAERLENSRLFGVVGKSVTYDQPNSFVERVIKATDEKMRTAPTLDMVDAQLQVFSEHPDWYEKYRKEVEVKI